MLLVDERFLNGEGIVFEGGGLFFLALLAQVSEGVSRNRRRGNEGRLGTGCDARLRWLHMFPAPAANAGDVDPKLWIRNVQTIREGGLPYLS